MDKVQERLKSLNLKLHHHSTPEAEKVAIRNTINKIYVRHGFTGNVNSSSEVFKTKALKGRVNYYHWARIKGKRINDKVLNTLNKRMDFYWHNPKENNKHLLIQSGIGSGLILGEALYAKSVSKKYNRSSKFKDSNSFGSYYAKRHLEDMKRITRGRKPASYHIPSSIAHITTSGALLTHNLLMSHADTNLQLGATFLGSMGASSVAKFGTYGVGYLKEKRNKRKRK